MTYLVLQLHEFSPVLSRDLSAQLIPAHTIYGVPYNTAGRSKIMSKIKSKSKIESMGWDGTRIEFYSEEIERGEVKIGIQEGPHIIVGQ